jgi:hypothetical protein
MFFFLENRDFLVVFFKRNNVKLVLVITRRIRNVWSPAFGEFFRSVSSRRDQVLGSLRSVGGFKVEKREKVSPTIYREGLRKLVIVSLDMRSARFGTAE